MELYSLGQYEPKPHEPNPPRQHTREDLAIHVPETLPGLGPVVARTLLDILKDLAGQDKQTPDRTS